MSDFPLLKVDKSSSLPVYQQIANDLTSRIEQAEWCVGDKIPSENELSAEYGVSRVTIRQALAKLEADGFIEKQRGRGAFLTAKLTRSVQELFLPQAGASGRSVNNTSIQAQEITTQAGAQIYEKLRVPVGTPLVYLERHFLRKHKLVAINRAWFALSAVPDMDKLPLIEHSITKTLQVRYNIEFGSVENYIESILLDAASAQKFSAVTPAPALKINTVYTDKNGTPFEYSITIWNGTDTQFHVMISSD